MAETRINESRMVQQSGWKLTEKKTLSSASSWSFTGLSASSSYRIDGYTRQGTAIDNLQMTINGVATGYYVAQYYLIHNSSFASNSGGQNTTSIIMNNATGNSIQITNSMERLEVPTIIQAANNDVIIRANFDYVDANGFLLSNHTAALAQVGTPLSSIEFFHNSTGTSTGWMALFELNI